jgi:hypothetical protein
VQDFTAIFSIGEVIHRGEFQLRYVRHGFMVKEADRDQDAQYRSLPGASAAMEARITHAVPIFDYPALLLVSGRYGVQFAGNRGGRQFPRQLTRRD